MTRSEDQAPPALTNDLIEKLPPGEYRDGAAPGLRLRVSAKGTRAFRWSATVNGRQVWVPIGRWSKKPRAGFVTLRDAHSRLEKLQAANREGHLAAQLAERKPAKLAAGTPVTVGQFAAEFLAHLDVSRRRPEQARGMFERDIIGTDVEPTQFAALPMAKVTKRDVRGVLEPIVKRDSPVAAGHTLRLMRQFFAWAVDREDDLPMPGFPKMKTIGAKKADQSKRYLTPEEIPAFWRALDASGMTPTIRFALRLLLLLGVRPGELGVATWDEFDLDGGRWVIPPEHQKMHRTDKPAKPFTVPLTPAAIDILRKLRALADSVESRYVLASFYAKFDEVTGKRVDAPLTEKALITAMRRLFEGKAPALKFEGDRPTPNDLRHTLRTHVEDTLGFPESVAERCLNHSRGAMVNTYAHGDYLAQRREALLAWDAYVHRLVTGEGAEVVALNVTAKPASR